MNVRCVRCWRMYSDTRQQYACPHNAIEETMTTGSILGQVTDKPWTAAPPTAAPPTARAVTSLTGASADAMRNRIKALDEAIAGLKRTVDVACHQITQATTALLQCEGERDAIQHDLLNIRATGERVLSGDRSGGYPGNNEG